MSAILELLTALLEYLDLQHKNYLYFSNLNYNNNYQRCRQSGMQAGDGKEGINKCWPKSCCLWVTSWRCC